MGPSNWSMVFESVDIVSETVFDFDREAKMEANCSSVTARGIVWVIEIGRCREKKLESPRARQRG